MKAFLATILAAVSSLIVNAGEQRPNLNVAEDLSVGGMEFVRVEKGATCADDFWIAKHEVTQEVFEAIMSENPSTQKGEGHPVETVSWHHAMDFCSRLTGSLRASQSLPNGHEVRLPLSSEWEWAARGGTKSQGHSFAGDSKAKEVGWTKEDSADKHHPVGLKKPNELGLYDMTGNVWEWCYDRLPAGKTGKPGADTRIKRGGSFFNNAATSHLNNIGEMAPSGKGPRFGFRVVIAKPVSKVAPANAQLSLAAEKRPNILWIITDDQRRDSIAAFNRIRRNGKEDSELGIVLSPHVDRLAAMGTTFINTFNHNPSCQPSRTIMHTGRYSHRTGVYGFEYHNPSGMEHWKPMVPEVLRDQAGYQTLTVGKLGLYAQHFANKKNPNGPLLYQTDLGYRTEFAAAGLVDWNAERPWVNGKAGDKVESFHFADGSQLTIPKEFEALKKRLSLFNSYRLGGGNAQSDDSALGETLGGLNPQSSDRIRDASFSSALLDYLDHTGKDYTDVLGRKQHGPDASKAIFIHCGFEFPHTPVLPPAEFREKFAKFKYEIPKLSNAEREQFPTQIRRFFDSWQTNHFTDGEKQQMVADYYAYCAYGDTLVGKLADGFISYSERHSRPWLILYVCGDNGWKLNEHGMGSKFLHYDHDLNNPVMVISSDKQRFPAGKVVTDFAGFVDMAPTFFAAAGIDIAAPEYNHLDGRDLAQTASGNVRPRDYVIAEPTWVIGPRAVIRTKDYKFAMRVRPHSGATFTKATAGKDMGWAMKAELKDIEPTLFDLRTDPGETNNVAFDTRYRAVLDSLRTKLQNIVLGDARVEVAWTKEVGDEVHRSDFAHGADDGVLAMPELIIQTK